MRAKILRYLRRFRRKFKKICIPLGISKEKNLPEVLSKVFKKLQKRTSGTDGKNFLDLMEQIVSPKFWLRLGKNSAYKLRDYFYFIVFLTSFNATPEGGSQMLKIATILGPNADSFLFHLKKFTSKEIMEITDRINLAIFQKAKQHFKRGFWKKSFPVAVDFTNDPFYGDKSCREIVGGKTKAGTNRFYRFAAITIIKSGIRFILAVRPALQLDQTVNILDQLITKAERIIKIKEIQLDRGFFNNTVINFLIRQNYKFEMPAVKNNRIKEEILVYHRSNKYAVFKYKFGNDKTRMENEEFTIFIVKNELKVKKKQDKPKSKKEILELYHVFATNKIGTGASKKTSKKVAKEYSKRWGIETGFKMINFFRIKTASKNFVVRLFCYLFSAIMYNLWILYNLLNKNEQIKGYILPSTQLKMLILIKSLHLLTLIRDENRLKTSGGDSP